MAWEWLFGKKNDEPKSQSTSDQKASALDGLRVCSVVEKQAVIEKWKGSSHTWGPGNSPRPLFVKKVTYTMGDLRKELESRAAFFERCADDRESRDAAREIAGMLSSGATVRYRWGAHKMELELHRFADDEFLFIEKEYMDYYC